MPRLTSQIAYPLKGADLLRSMRETLGEGSWPLIGIDCAKNTDILTRAYDDSQHITARRSAFAHQCQRVAAERLWRDEANYFMLILAPATKRRMAP